MQYKTEFDLSQTLNGDGASKEKITAALDTIAKEIAAFRPDSFRFDTLQHIMALLEETGSIILCMTSVDVKDSRAKKWEAAADELSSKLSSLSLEIDNLLALLSQRDFQSLVQKHPAIAFHLQEKRNWIREKLPTDREKLIETLSSPGHRDWTSLYYTLIGEIEFEWEGNTCNISTLETKLRDRNPDIRTKAFTLLQQGLKRHENLFGVALNAIARYRMKVYELRKWDTLHESLHANRISKKTLTAMQTSIDANAPSLHDYIDKKKRALGLQTVRYFDLDAPIDPQSPVFSWDEAVHMILDAFGAFGPKLKAFAEEALKKGWVDVAKRPHKRAGGFCTSLPLSKMNLILLTFGENFSSIATLAHELGHAYHSHVLYKKPLLAQHYPMCIAESASTFCEILLTDHLLKRYPKLMLDEIYSRHATFLMDLHARYLFDFDLHTKAAEHFLSSSELSSLMQDAQNRAYGKTIEPFDHFWCYKMHFYFTDTPFYNWPYTFGYLMSRGLFHHLKDDPAREDKWILFFQDSGSMQLEELAKKHLNLDITQTDFWNTSCRLPLPFNLHC